MNKFLIGLVVVFILLWLPYFIKTSSLKTISETDIPEVGGWAPLVQGNLYYRWYEPEISNNEIVVLVHGFSTPHFVWDGMKEFLVDAGYKVLVYDHFGRGFSERPSVVYDQDLYVESLKGLLDYQNISQSIHLVGYSMGGPVVGYFTQQYPDLVKSISFIAPAGFMKEDSVSRIAVMPVVGDWFWQVFGKWLYFREVRNEATSSDNSVALPQSEFVKKYSVQMKYKGLIEALLSTVRNFNFFNAKRMFDKVGDLKIPTITIWGTDDGVVPFAGSSELMQSIPHSELKIINEGKHDIAYANPSIVGNTILEFLDKQQKF
ncbi:alpha/beta hydrolase [Gammaproteobacteria bacterium]|jgi:pimeloyl-ACP methyl ester carboxylesterase|nr:alpha/beta hydrolase [Gammaproteobacteria bacterium]